MTRFQKQDFCVDMLYNVNKKELKYKMVNEKHVIDDGKECIINGIPISDKGWVPHIVMGQYRQIKRFRIASISIDMFGKHIDNLF